ncbi:MAG: methyltransferase domain-containing protein [Pseudomonadales bacterium]
MPTIIRKRRSPPLVGRFYDTLFSDPLLGEFWGEAFANCGYWDDGVTDGHSAGNRLVDESLRTVPPEHIARVLDVACGHGGTTARLLEHFPNAEVFATGIDAGQLTQAAQNAPAAHFEVASPLSLPFEARSFDLVACYEAAFHFDTRADFLAECARVLRAGGWLVMSDLLMLRTTGYMPAANYLAGPEAYADVLRDAGFSDVTVVDITTPGWRGFRRALTRFLAGKPPSALSMRDQLMASVVWSYVIRFNVLVAARR